MEKYAQGSVAVVALLVVVLIGLVVGYVAFSGNFPGVTRLTQGSNDTLGYPQERQLGTPPSESAPVENTTIAKQPSKNATGKVSATVTATYYPQDKSYRLICDATGFRPTAYTWNFGDGSKPVLSTNKDVFYQYDKPGRYKVVCSAADDKNFANASINVIAQ